MAGSTGTPAAPWQATQTCAAASMFSACARIAADSAVNTTRTPRVNVAKPHGELQAFVMRRRRAVGLGRAPFAFVPLVDCKSNNVVATFVVKLGISASPDHDILLAAHR